MADYIGTTRTNYFRVTDEDEYQRLFEKLVSDDGEVIDFTEADDTGQLMHGFGAYGSIYALAEEDGDDDFDAAFLTPLQAILPKNEAFILMTAGWEKLRYVVGGVTVLTHDKYRYVDTHTMAVTMARDMLDNPDFATQLDY